jgi:hypothetical protein
MKTWLGPSALGILLALAAPAAADHDRLPAAAPADTTDESSLDLDLKIGPRGFRLGGRLSGGDGFWLNGQTREDGFSLDGRIEHGGRARTFKFNADIAEWLRAFRRGATDL